MISPGAAIGAPPDPLSRAGQDWGLALLNPLVAKRRGFTPFLERRQWANMRHVPGVLADRPRHVVAAVVPIS